MKYNRIGTSDLWISEISFGCMSLEKEQNDNADILRTAFDKGMNFFDTADLYDRGWNEECVGQALKEIRDKVLISTKVGNRWTPGEEGWEWNPTKDYILSAVDDSLQRLQTDYIDLYMLHGGTIEDPIDEIIEAFEILKEKGKIREYGISSIRPNVIREYIERSNIASVMMQYSLLDRRPEEECLELLNEANISVLARGTLAKGLLIDKAPASYMNYSKEEVAELQKALKETENPIAASLRFVLNNPAVASAVTGIRTKEQLQDLFSHYRELFNKEQIEEVAGVLEPNVYEKHR